MSSPAIPGRADPAPAGPSLRVLALLVFLLSLCASGASLLANRQLGALGGLTDEYFALGAKLRVTGTLGLSRDEPITLRAPGYPAFVAGLITILVPPPRLLSQPAFDAASRKAVYLAQAILLAASASLLFLFLAAHVRREVALLAGLLFGLNAFCLVLVGLLHYDVLHMFLMLLATMVLTKGVETGRGRTIFAAGLLWGVSALIRPVTLLLPPFLGLALLFRTSVRKAIPLVLFFTLGMVGPVAPWAVRDYALTGRVVLVSQNAWAAIWAQGVKVLDFDPNHYSFGGVAEEFRRIFAQVTGEPDYSYVTFVRFNSELEDRFRAEMFLNLRRNPWTYARNSAAAFGTFNLDIDSVVLQVFRYLQTAPPGAEGDVKQEWFRSGNPQDFASKNPAKAFQLFEYALTALGFVGIVAAIRKKASWLLAVAAAYLSVVFAHTFFFMSLMYYYTKLPFLFVFAFYGFDVLYGVGNSALKRPRLGHWITVAMGGWGLLLSARILFGG